MMWFRTHGLGGDALASIRQDMCLESLRRAGLSKRGAQLLLGAGYTTRAALQRAPWTAEEAGDLHQSAEWRLSTTAGCTSSVLDELRSFRAEIAPA